MPILNYFLRLNRPCCPPHTKYCRQEVDLKSVSGHCGDNGWQLTNRIQTGLLSPHKVLQTKSVSGHCEDNGWQLTNRIQSGPGVQWDKRMKIFPFTIFINISTLTRLGLFVKLFAYSDKNDKIHSVFDEQIKFAVGRQEMGF